MIFDRWQAWPDGRRGGSSGHLCCSAIGTGNCPNTGRWDKIEVINDYTTQGTPYCDEHFYADVADSPLMDWVLKPVTKGEHDG